MMKRPRIVTLLASATEIVHALGAGDQLVGVSHECDFPPQVARLPRLTHSLVAAEASSGEIDADVRRRAAAGEALYALDAARLAELRPDVVITQAQCDVCAVKHQDVLDAVAADPSLRHAQVVALNPRTFEDLFADVDRVGQAIGQTSDAARAIAEYRERVDSVVRATSRLSPTERPRVAFVEWIEPMMLAGNWTPRMIELAGGRQPLANDGRHSEYADWESVRAFAPQALVVAPCGFDLERTQREAAMLWNLPGFADVPAVRAQRAYAVDGDAYFNRSGPRLVDSLEILAGLLHPSLFGWPPETRHGSSVWAPLSDALRT